MLRVETMKARKPERIVLLDVARTARTAAVALTAMVTSGVTLVAGCGAPVRDGGSGGGGGQGGQAGGGGAPDAGGSGGGSGGGGGGGSGCVEGEPACDGRNVRTCMGGRPAGPVTGTCMDACSNGRCTSAACAEVESKRNFVGCEFYTLDMDNSGLDDQAENMVAIGNPSETDTAKVTLQQRTAKMPWTGVKSVMIKPGGVDVFPMNWPASIADRHVEGPGLGVAHAYRIVSDNPIVAYHIQADDQQRPLNQTSQGSILIPTHVLGRAYMAIAYTHTTTMLTTRYGALAPAGQLTVVAVHDGTKVTVTAASAVGKSPGAHFRAGGIVPATDPGGSFKAMLDDGDVLQVYTDREGDELTGTRVEADKPLAVFSGNFGTSYGVDALEGVESADGANEQMIPLSAWGRSYVASRIMPQQGLAFAPGSGCTITGGESKSLSRWRILASEDATRVTFDPGSPSITGLPPGPVILGKGEFIEIGVRGPEGKSASDPGTPGDFHIEADKSILVAQFPACEPAMALAISAEQLLTDFLFVTPPIFDHQIAVVRKAGTEVNLDGKTLSDALFTGAGGGFEVARVDVPKCKGALSTCGHRIRGTQIGVAVRGQDAICGYVFSGGMGVRCVNATAGCR